MGQKVNPISNRLGIIRGWDSNWYGGNASDDEVNQYDYDYSYQNNKPLEKAGADFIGFLEQLNEK